MLLSSNGHFSFEDMRLHLLFSLRMVAGFLLLHVQGGSGISSYAFSKLFLKYS